MKRLLFIFILSSTIVGLLSGCVTDQTNRPVDTTNLNQLESLTSESPGASQAQRSVSNIRMKAIRETATSLGAQAGLAARSKKINKVLKEHRHVLDQTFNFRALLLNHHVLPPVLSQGDQLLNLASPNAIRLADKTYKIVNQARFVTTAPNWRQYLMMDYQKPQVPDKTLLPKTPQEQQVWVKNLQKGWKKGLRQAKNIYSDNLARLERDYKGMLLYRELLSRNIVSKPHVSQSNLGVTSNDNDSQLYVNDKVLQITALPKLNPDSEKWRPVLTNE